METDISSITCKFAIVTNAETVKNAWCCEIDLVKEVRKSFPEDLITKFKSEGWRGDLVYHDQSNLYP